VEWDSTPQNVNRRLLIKEMDKIRWQGPAALQRLGALDEAKEERLTQQVASRLMLSR
jgi:hypothetical protein